MQINGAGSTRLGRRVGARRGDGTGVGGQGCRRHDLRPGRVQGESARRRARGRARRTCRATSAILKRSASAVEQAAAGTATLRINVNCAGIGWAQRTIGRQGEPHDFEAFKTVVTINLIGTFNVMRLAASAISKTEPLDDGERGVVVNTASVAAFEGQIGQISYSASKGGIVGMTLPAARDLSAVGIRVNTIAPGIMDTPLLGLLPEENRQALGQGVLFPKRLGRAAGVRRARHRDRRERLPER